MLMQWDLPNHVFANAMGYDLNACALPPNSYIKILTPKGDGIRRQDFWEVLKSQDWNTHEQD